jgi:hypothetical protein
MLSSKFTFLSVITFSWVEVQHFIETVFTLFLEKNWTLIIINWTENKLSATSFNDKSFAHNSYNIRFRPHFDSDKRKK